MVRRAAFLGLLLVLAGAGLGPAAHADESGAWEAEHRGNIRERLSESVQDLLSGRPRTYWDRGLSLETPKRSLAVHVGYEGQFDAIWYGGMESAVETAVANKWTSGIEARRSRLKVEGFVLRDWFFRARYGWSGLGRPVFQDLFVEWAGLKNMWRDRAPAVRVGQVKEPITMDWMNGALRTTFAERAMFTTSLVPNRNPGVRIHGTGFKERLTYQAGVFSVNAGSLNEVDEGSGTSFTARLTGLPWAPARHPQHLLHVGLSTSWRDSVGDLRYRSTPESWRGPAVVDTGTFAADRTRTVAGELFLQRGRFSLLAEGAWTQVQLPGGGTCDYWGAYAHASYFLTSPGVAFNRTFGTLGRVRPKCTVFCKAKSGLGALEIAARYSTLDLGNGPFPGGTARNVTLGLNWYARDNLRVVFNYIHTDVEDAHGVAGADGTMNTLVLRFEYDL